MEYTLIDPEENSNMDYSISQKKYDNLSPFDQRLYEPQESEDDEDFLDDED